MLNGRINVFTEVAPIVRNIMSSYFDFHSLLFNHVHRLYSHTTEALVPRGKHDNVDL